MEKALYILHGSRSGNSRAIAHLARDYAEYLGIETSIESMQDFNPEKLKRIRNLLIAVSTHGEGDPPFQAEEFYNYLHNQEVPELRGLNFSVLALGDSSYKHFCKTGKDIAKRFKKLGAAPVYPLVECDIDFEDSARQWVRNTVDLIQKEVKPRVRPENNRANFVFDLKLDDADDDYFRAMVLEKRLLTGRNSTKRIYNLRLDLKNSGFDYKPGDSIGIFCGNSRLLVDRIIRKLNFDPTHQVDVKGKKTLLKHALVNEFELTVITTVVVQKYARIVPNTDLLQLMESKKAMKQYVETRDILDLITDFPGVISPEEFVSILRKLAPRLYSVASCELSDRDQVDLAVGIIEYVEGGRIHQGVGSAFLSDILEEGEKIPVTFEPNEKFRLPDDTDRAVIMIGTGTGVSPYRAFLQERNLTSNAANWLFFGERNEATDFLYREDFLQFMENGVLTRLDMAFSRDQEERVYVSHKINENGKEVYRWLQDGAIVYLCGNKRTMAKDVRLALLEVFRKEGGMSEDKSLDYLEQLKSEKRFREDVY
ncbi:MAG: flavodoxin domain-containing protein [Bacteroidales bacterium]